jgi:hypothetical protein
LTDHDDTGCLYGTTQAGNGEQFDEASEETCVGRKTRLLNEHDFLFHLRVDVDQLSCSKDGLATETEKRLVSLTILLLGHEPSGRFRAEPDTENKRNSRDECRSELQTPRDITDVLDSKVGRRTEKDTESSPDLPRHYQTTSDLGRCDLSREDRDSNFFQTHADAKKNTAHDELLPVLCDCHTDWREKREDSSNKDDTAATEPVIERVRDPASKKEDGKIGARVDETDEPLIGRASSSSFADGTTLGNTECCRERQIRTIGTSLIPSLNGSYLGVSMRPISSRDTCIPATEFRMMVM